MNVTTVGIDLAKNVFSVHGVGRDGKALLRRSVGRADLLPMFALI
ncbi:transposase [Aromatoleum tolulyticum]|uniref:Transposase n=1 Tax=Aromatoleum tolulyticum TaxID=34027 RepID=A0A1N7BR43_9RHOO|nr:transposase [Aromatoleum tolulyticum]